MKLYIDERKVTIPDERVFLGDSFGVVLVPRIIHHPWDLEENGEEDNHICFLIVSEDDGNWFLSEGSGASSSYLSDLKAQISLAEDWIKHNAVKDGRYGYRFK